MRRERQPPVVCSERAVGLFTCSSGHAAARRDDISGFAGLPGHDTNYYPTPVFQESPEVTL